jgi:outer membrane protein assembly factor BamD
MTDMHNNTPNELNLVCLSRWVATLMVVLLLHGCGGKDELVEEDQQAAELYQAARDSLSARNYNQAITLYKQLRNRYPFGRYAEQGQLDLAFAYHEAGEPENVTATVERFIRTYPTHPNVDYAYYLRGLTYYEQNVGFLSRMFPERISTRDQGNAKTSFDYFSELIRRYPQSRYVPDARQRMVFLRNNLAAYEVEVARYYIRRKAYVAAVNRAKFVLETYPQTSSINNALATMARAYTKLDMPELAEDAKRVLTLNDPQHPYLTGDDGERGFFAIMFSIDIFN